VAKKGKEVLHELVFVGSHQTTAMQPLEATPAPPTVEHARAVALQVLRGIRGRYRSSQHFKQKMAERHFDVFDMEYAIRNGMPTEPGEYSPAHKDFKYTFRGTIDCVDFDAVFSLSSEHCLIESPLMILITGCWKTKSGKRKKSY
jgi:hypothetical protein